MGEKQKIKSLKGLELNLFTLRLEYTKQSGEVEASCLKSEPYCRFCVVRVEKYCIECSMMFRLEVM